MVVIKANAYGHGMLAVAESLPNVDAFAVARVPEAIELRKNGIQSEIVLLTGILDEEELRSAIDWDLQMVVHCEEQLELLATAEEGAITIWLKLDTGMNRLGFDPANAPQLLERLRSLPAVREVRLMTHLASADELNNDATIDQVSQFLGAIDDEISDISICNSAGALGWPDVQNDIDDIKRTNWIRPGIVLFGISPFAGKVGVDFGLEPVMQFEARLIAIKPLSAGDRVGYKGAYISDNDSVMGLVSVGYGDGYSRHFRSGTPVLLNGRRVTLIGNVSMDTIAVDLGPNATDQVGDIATLWGDGLPAEEVAPWASAIPYELVCGVMNREASQIDD
jgi:alanine racemase